MPIYLLLKVDLSGSDCKPTCVSIHMCKSVAENKALHVLEDFQHQHGGSFDDETLQAWSENRVFAIQLNIVEAKVETLSFTINS